MAGVLPALLVALFAGWCGTFPGAAGAWGAIAGQAALAAAALAGARSWDPMALGRGGSLLPPALLLTVLASWWASPVERAGRVGLLLLPAYLLLPAAVAACWREGHRRRLGLRALALVGGGVALWAIGDWAYRFLSGEAIPRPAMPLGHHNLLAAWLAILLPLLVLGLGERGAWRWVSAGAVAAALVALVAARSATALAAVAAEAAAAAVALPRLRRPLLVLLALGAAAAAPRLARVATGTDPSAAVRATYFEGGWAGIAERPLLGWGPGSVPWTAGSFLPARPGVTPAGEVVGQLHSLPLDLAYELGLPGALVALGLAAAFVLSRRAERPTAEDPPLALGSLVGLLGAGVCALGSSWLACPALPLTVAVVAGAGLAAGRPSTSGCAPAARGASSPSRARIRHGRLAPRLAAGAWALAAAAVVLPLDRAHLAYDRAARAASPEEVRRELERAVRLDPGFPLYPARLAWYLPEPDPELARRAAEGAPGVAALWLSAGVLVEEAGSEGGEEALERALALDPLGGAAAYYLAKGRPQGPLAAECGARTLLGEPRLGAATFWDGREPLLREVAARLLAWEGVEPGWREAMAAALGEAAGERGEVADFPLGRDDPGGGLSLHAFRRRPWGAPWFAEPVDGSRLGRLTLPPAGSLPTSRPEAFPRGGCAVPPKPGSP